MDDFDEGLISGIISGILVGVLLLSAYQSSVNSAIEHALQDKYATITSSAQTSSTTPTTILLLLDDPWTKYSLDMDIYNTSEYSLNETDYFARRACYPDSCYCFTNQTCNKCHDCIYVLMIMCYCDGSPYWLNNTLYFNHTYNDTILK